MDGLTVAVTGPTGEIGRPLMRALERAPQIAQVRGMARGIEGSNGSRRPGKTRLIRGDIGRRDDVAGLVDGADVVVHLAYAKFAGAEEARDVNLRGSRNVFEAAVAAGAKRIVFTSSIAAYGSDPDGEQPLDESTPARGSANVIYSTQKAELEQLLVSIVGGTAVGAYTLRPCIVAGPDSLELVTRLPYVQVAAALPAPLRRIANALPGEPVLPDFGVSFQLVHGDDLADAIVAAIAGRGPAGTYNLAGPGEVTTTDLARELGWHSIRLPRPVLDGVTATATRLPRVGQRLDWLHLLRSPIRVSSARARAHLGWAPAHNALDTLKATVKEATCGN
jgi:nucleoside-diphosphate-sugar epimerase